MTYSSLQAVNSTYISRSSCDEQYLCLFCEHETNDPEDLHGLVVNKHACTLIELSDKYNNGEHGQYSLLSKITFDKCKNFFVCQVCGFRSRLHTNVNRHVATKHSKIFPHVYDDCGKGFSRMLLLSHISRVRLCVTPQTAAHQAPLSLGFSRQEYWSGLPFSSPSQVCCCCCCCVASVVSDSV